jgi:hypothetical protein
MAFWCGDVFQTQQVNAELGGWTQAHNTRCLQDVIKDVGGMGLALRLLAPRKDDTQVTCMHILC